jgi:hypothetical protein
VKRMGAFAATQASHQALKRGGKLVVVEY